MEISLDLLATVTGGQCKTCNDPEREAIEQGRMLINRPERRPLDGQRSSEHR